MSGPDPFGLGHGRASDEVSRKVRSFIGTELMSLEDGQTAAVRADGNVAIVGCVLGIPGVPVAVHNVLAKRTPSCLDDVDLHPDHVRPD